MLTNLLQQNLIRGERIAFLELEYGGEQGAGKQTPVLWTGLGLASQFSREITIFHIQNG